METAESVPRARPHTPARARPRHRATPSGRRPARRRSPTDAAARAAPRARRGRCPARPVATAAPVAAVVECQHVNPTVDSSSTRGTRRRRCPRRHGTARRARPVSAAPRPISHAAARSPRSRTQPRRTALPASAGSRARGSTAASSTAGASPRSPLQDRDVVGPVVAELGQAPGNPRAHRRVRGRGGCERVRRSPKPNASGGTTPALQLVEQCFRARPGTPSLQADRARRHDRRQELGRRRGDPSAPPLATTAVSNDQSVLGIWALGRSW